MTEAELDFIFSALAHPVRRRLVDRLVECPGMAAGDLSQGHGLGRIAIHKHLKSLESAGLVLSRKQGRQRLHYFKALPLQRIVNRWSDNYGRFWAGRMVELKERIESRAAPGANRKAAQSA